MRQVVEQLRIARAKGLDVAWHPVMSRDALAALAARADRPSIDGSSGPRWSSRLLLSGTIDGVPFLARAVRQPAPTNVLLGLGIHRDHRLGDAITIAQPAHEATDPCDVMNADLLLAAVEQLDREPGAAWAAWLDPALEAQPDLQAANARGFVIRSMDAIVLGATMAAPSTPGAIGIVAAALSNAPNDGVRLGPLPGPTSELPSAARDATERRVVEQRIDAARSIRGSRSSVPRGPRRKVLPLAAEPGRNGIAVITAVHPSYAHLLPDAYHSLVAQRWAPGDGPITWVLQVDGAPTDEGFDAIERLVGRARHEGAIAISAGHNGSHLGIANTFNAALERVEADAFVRLDADDVLGPQTLWNLRRILDDRPDLGWLVVPVANWDPSKETPSEVVRRRRDLRTHHRAAVRRTFRSRRLIDLPEGTAADLYAMPVRRQHLVSGGYPEVRTEHLLACRTAVARAAGGAAPLPREEDFGLLYAMSDLAPGAWVDWPTVPMRLYRSWSGQASGRGKGRIFSGTSLKQMGETFRVGRAERGRRAASSPTRSQGLS